MKYLKESRKEHAKGVLCSAIEGFIESVGVFAPLAGLCALAFAMVVYVLNIGW